jgi:hypothetical protein
LEVEEVRAGWRERKSSWTLFKDLGVGGVVAGRALEPRHSRNPASLATE